MLLPRRSARAPRKRAEQKAETKSISLAREVNALCEQGNNTALLEYIREIKPKINELPEKFQRETYSKLLLKRREDSLHSLFPDSGMEQRFRTKIDFILAKPEKLAALTKALQNFSIDDRLPQPHGSRSSPESFIMGFHDSLEHAAQQVAEGNA